MNALFVAEGPFFPEQITGTSRSILELCNLLRGAGHQADILAGTQIKGHTTRVMRDTVDGITVYRTARPLASLPALAASRRPDVVIAFGAKCTDIASVSLELGYRAIVWLTSSYADTFNNSELDHRIQLVASSSFIANRCTRYLGHNPVVIPPAITATGGEINDNTHRNSGGPDGTALFLNPIRRKGLERVLDIARARPDHRFLVYESEILRKRWKRYCYIEAARCGNVEIRNSTQYLDSLYGGVQLLLVPSISEEGFGHPVTEAQQRGIPVLASNRGNLSGNVGEGGMVLDLDAPLDDWLACFDRLITPGQARDDARENATEHAGRKELDVNSILDQWLALLTRIVNNPVSGLMSRD